jgi:two-component system NtrC family sensor kinase
MVADMSKKEANDRVRDHPGRGSVEGFHSLSLHLLQLANLGGSTSDFLRHCTKTLLDFSGCDSIGVFISDDPVHCYGETTSKPSESYVFDATKPGSEAGKSTSDHAAVFDPLIGKILAGNSELPSRYMTAKGSFCTGDVGKCLLELGSAGMDQPVDKADKFIEYRSMALIPIVANGRTIGLLQMKCVLEHYFTVDEIEFYEGISDILGATLVSHRTQIALGERIKELSCLYGIAQIAAEPGYTLDDVMRNVVGLLPPAWQYPEITEGRILLDNQIFKTPGYTGNFQSQVADIHINGKYRGYIEVTYSEIMPELAEGPFLREERNLIDAIARLIAQIIERKQAEEDSIKLQEQLRHADRLATIGQLAAGVAHEFNEPLGNVLGFAQLILRNENLPGEIKNDIDKIVTASMHARQVVKKLMLFARQMPAEKTRVNLNTVIEEGLYFLDARCTKAGIEMVRLLSPDIREIMADQSQMHQVLVNLVVNAIQAMPDGGTITISTECLDKNICLRVTDTGEGMNDEILEQLFVPFFTTKDVDVGTGLGLPVVHGIVTSHGGSIEVSSKVGKGSSFEIQLPIAGPDEVEVTE